MRPKKRFVAPELFKSRLEQILNLEHPLIVLSTNIDWLYFEKEFGAFYSENRGRSGAPIRLMVGLHYLKNAFDLSDESVVAGFIENPYWQYFCGYEYFQHEFPIDPSSLTRWRKRVGDSGVEKLLKELLATAKRSGHLKRCDVNKVNADTTVQEKAIAFPTDARLYHKMRQALVRAAEARDIQLRQSYRRLSKQALAKQGRYSHARQMKRSKKMTRKLKTYLGRVLQRHAPRPDAFYDTTVQEKAIAFPTDARLYHKMRQALVRAAEARDIQLRQSYRRLSKQALAKQGRYSHARQMKRSKKMTRKLKTYLGRVARDIERKLPEPDAQLGELLAMAERLLLQQRNDKNKLYSIHAPEVECISKGKVHKRYEFGCKVSMVTSARSNWILGISAIHSNPYDGHTLKEALAQVERLVPWQPKVVTVDLGYCGHNYQGTTEVQIVNYRSLKSKTRSVRKWFKRRAAIEPVFGHLKSDNRMSRNHLKGTEGDKVNALLCACGFNFRKLLRAFWFWVQKMFGRPAIIKLKPHLAFCWVGCATLGLPL